jgi:uncharacterized BrkB/YihY/UPF0761 family membrane protein
VLQKFGNDQAAGKAALMAYYGLFAFALLLLLATILGFALSGDPGLHERLIDSALGNFPVIGDQLRSEVTCWRGTRWRWSSASLGPCKAVWASVSRRRTR